MMIKTTDFRTQPHLQERWNRIGRKLAFASDSVPEWRRWRTRTVRALRSLTGHDTMISANPAPRITEEIEFRFFIRQRMEIHTEPGIVMPFFVLIPKEGKPPYPAVIAPHGHCSGGKLAVAGCREIPEIAEVIKTFNYDYGVQFARAGFVTFCPDARGFGERQEDAAKGSIVNSSCQWINNMAYPLGQTIAGMWAWDIHRLVDYIQSRRDCAPGRIGCAGLSGGGLQTLWAAAFDERIRCAVISGYLYGYKESILDMHTNCACNYVPRLYEYADMGDIAALIAPRPLLVETGTRDPLNGASGLANVRSQIRTIRQAYRLLHAGNLLKHDIFEGEHRWNGIHAIPWMQRHLEKANAPHATRSRRRPPGKGE